MNFMNEWAIESISLLKLYHYSTFIFAQFSGSNFSEKAKHKIKYIGKRREHVVGKPLRREKNIQEILFYYIFDYLWEYKGYIFIVYYD